MNGADMLALLPLLIIAATSIIVMLGIAVRRSHALTAGLTLAGLAAAFISVCTVATPRQVTGLLLVDRYALFYMGLIIASSAAVTVFCLQYFEKQDGHREELYLLLLIATFGCAVLVASSHFASFVLGLEILSVALYAMVAYLTGREQALEAGIKYLILASSSAAFLLFGAALIYAETGSMQFERIGEISLRGSGPGLLLPGVALTITGIGFKLGVVPFHLWTPDVYEGAPAPVAAFVATTSKSAMVAVLLRYFQFSGALQYSTVFAIFAAIAIASMCAGNLLALRQKNVKRILAYSSIAHFGYILVGFLAGGEMAIEAVSFYLAAYTVTILVAFGIVTVLSGPERDSDDLEDYRGLFWRRPWIAGVFTVALFSLAGIPATMGFLSKFYVLAAGANAAAWPLIIILVVTSVAGLFYYLRIVVMLYSAPTEQVASSGTVGHASAFVLGALTLLLIWLGVYPSALLDLIRQASNSLL